MEMRVRAWSRAVLYAAATRAAGTVTVSSVRELGRVAGATSRGAGEAARAVAAGRAGRRCEERGRSRGSVFVSDLVVCAVAAQVPDWGAAYH